MKKITLIYLGLFASVTTLLAQTNEKSGKDSTHTVVFEAVQQPAEFKDGLYGWKNYLEENLNVNLGSRYIKLPKGQKTAQATVIVSFVIDREGNVSDVHAEKTIPENIHPKLIKEAIRVIQSGPKWIPAKQNGKLVIYRHKQSITWVVSEE